MRCLGLKFGVLSFLIAVFIYVPYLEAGQLTALQQSARELRNKGYASQKKGDIDAAMSFYQRALTLDPAYFILYNDIGVIYEAKGQPQEAARYYLKCIEKDPKCISAYSNLALLYEEKGDYQESAYYWRRRIKLGEKSDPWTDKAQQHLADIAAKLGVSVEDVGRKAAPLTGKSYTRSELDEVLDKFERDIKRAAKAKSDEGQKQDEKDSKDKLAAFAAGVSEVEAKNKALEEKLAAFSQALSKEKEKNKKEKSALYAQLAASYVKAKLYNEAIEAYKKSLTLRADDPLIYYYLGLLYQYQRKDSKIAVECFREYLELEPYGKYNEKARDLINILQ
ncbi:MAG: tetratricopeptide repeat protein [Candidatus Omnitrophota bacterium]|nr:MAG: tetratricopeptide repeat protein [Candidatus Omnitrophota bacterium]